MCFSILFRIMVILPFLPSISTQANETLLVRHLLSKISSSARPVLLQNQPINLTFGLELVHVVRLEEVKQKIGMKVWLRMKWYNELMTWRPSEWGNIKSTRATPDQVWTPDVYLIEDTNAKISVGPSKYMSQVILQHDGIHKWYVPALLENSCRFNFKNFPFDLHKCKFKFMSWSYDQSELDITPDPTPMITHYYINSSEWTLVKLQSEVVPEKYNCCPNYFVRIEYTIELHRKPLYYIFNVIIPCFIQMLIILFTFLLPPETGERVGVSVTVLLVFAVYLEVLRTALPKTSASIPALSKFYLSAMLGSAFSTMATCFVLVIHFKGAEKGARPIPGRVRRIFIGFLAPRLFVRVHKREHTNSELIALNKDINERMQRNSSMARNNASVSEKNGSVRKSSVVRQRSLSSSIRKKNEEEDIKKLGNINVSKETMDRLFDQTNVITSLIKDKNVQDEIGEEWCTLSKVFDRIFFLMFLAYFLTMSFLIFLPVYLSDVSSHASHGDW